MKITKSHLKELIREAVKKKLNEMNVVDTKISQLNRIKMENDLTVLDLLEDVLEFINNDVWEQILKAIKIKYGYKVK